jgi:hypothetical protein
MPFERNRLDPFQIQESDSGGKSQKQESKYSAIHHERFAQKQGKRNIVDHNIFTRS